jgi:truncated hemoglobin YjbI
MRHAAFAVTPDARDRWLRLMSAAVDSLNLSPMDHAELTDYLERAAFAMVNSFDEPGDGSTDGDSRSSLL